MGLEKVIGNISLWRRVAALGIMALGVRMLAVVMLSAQLQARAGVFGGNIRLSRGSDGYEKIAQMLASGNGYRFAPELGETMYLLPVYPTFLSLLFRFTDHHLFANQLAQSIFDSITCCLIYLIGTSCFRSQAATIGAVLYALYPGAWIACSRYVTEPMFAFLVTTFVFMLGGYLKQGGGWRLILAGLCCAASTLCKSVAGALPLFLLACVVVLPLSHICRKRAIVALVICNGLTLCAAMPWIIRNYKLTGEFVYPSTSGGIALYDAQVIVSHPRQSIRMSLNQAAAEVRQLAQANGIRLDSRDYYPRWFYAPRDEMKLDRMVRAIALERILATPGSLAKHIWGNIWRFWVGGPTKRASLVAAFINLPLLLLALFSLRNRRDWNSPGLWLWISACIYLYLGHVIVLGIVRYSLTVMPLVCLLGGSTADRWLSAVKK